MANIPSVGDTEVDGKIKEWLDWDKNQVTRNEISSLCESNNVEQLRKLLLKRLEFGTAGLRGAMGTGYSQMNDLVIIQTAQGLAIYLEECFRDLIYKQGVVIGYDGRHNSKRWAELTASILLNRNIPVYLYSKVCPTPFVAFAVLHYKSAAGVMVTASHNPKNDNGFKVYWQNGAQETLTGFKWMGNKTEELQKEGKNVLFAFEEAIGFMCYMSVLDKDGISAAIRYPTSLMDGKYEIVSVRDLTTGYDSSQPDHKAILPVSKSSQMITFTFSNGLVTTLRTSGTEPKIKYYTELCASPTEKDLKVIQATLDEMVGAIVEEFLQPEENGLIPKSN
ncbi:Phosphoglucomutase-2 [Blattella germanica]|nr:Phosphoglucomutase-2 [Blattella germanica]